MASGQNIADEARADLHDTDATNLRWPDVEMLGHVNASIRAIMEIVPEANVVQETISISDGESRQALPAGGIKFIRAWNNDLFAVKSPLVVAVDDTAAVTDHVMTTPDGINWTRIDPVPNKTWVTVAFSPTLRLWAAGNQAGGGSDIMTSPDGVNWTLRVIGAPDTMVVEDIIWASGFGLFIAVGTSSSSGAQDAMWSSDGITWTMSSIATVTSALAVAESPSLGIAIMIDDEATDHNIFTTTDGKVWTDSGFNFGTNIPVDMVWAEGFGLFLLTVGGAGGVYSSPDGTTWTQRSTLGDGFAGVGYSPSLDIAVLVSGDDEFASTTDGITWTPRSSPAELLWREVCWSEDIGLFVAVAAGGGSNLAGSSPDGINWTLRNTGFSRDWQGIACGETSSPARGTSMTHVELDSMDSAFPEWTFLSGQAANLNYPAPAGASQCDHFAHDPREPSIYHVFPPSLTTFSIFLTYAKFPDATTLLADTYPLGDEYLDAAVALVKARMLEKDGRHGSASDRRVDAYNDFLRALGTKVDSESEFDPSKNRPPGDKHG